LTPYGRAMRLILRYYDVRTALLKGQSHAGRKPKPHQHRRRLPPEEVA
jgi:hypothetical protein